MFFLRRKAEPEARFVVIHDLSQCCESSIMIEAALRVSPESRQGSSTIAVGWGAVGLEGIGANFRRGVQVFPGSVKRGGRWQVAQFAFPRRPLCHARQPLR
jgi:hypothetical protein